jgi:hypothetical protein
MEEKVMARYLTLNVTKTGLKKGERDSFDNCPVARALKAVGCTDVFVSRNYLEFTYKGFQYKGLDSVAWPIKALETIRKWEFGKEIKPFKFRLKLA